MNYEEKSDFEINERVGKLVMRGQLIKYHEQKTDGVLGLVGLDEGDSALYITTERGRNQKIDFCNNPSDAWPIIVDNHISIENRKNKDALALVKGDAPYNHENPLRAAMIVYLMMNEDKQC